MLGIEVLHPGLLTTIQDNGRYFFQKFGVPVSGVMDKFSYRIGNMLLENEFGDACLEVTMLGPSLKFQIDTAIAITGGDLKAKINGKNISMWKSILVKKNDILSFSGIRSGSRAYIFFKGGIPINKIMGSRSTYIKASIGGVNGKALDKGDIIPLKNFKFEDYKPKKLPVNYIPKYLNNNKIRVIMGPQDDYFTKKGIYDFFNNEYKITNDCDRMGFRLDGKVIEHINGSDIISDGISFGAIQIPGHGKPIIMMADRQTTGGYAKIANVISEDLEILAQSKPGDTIEFSKIEIHEAHEILREKERKFNIIRKELDYQKTIEIKNIKKYSIKINKKNYNVKVEEIE